MPKSKSSGVGQTAEGSKIVVTVQDKNKDNGKDKDKERDDEIEKNEIVVEEQEQEQEQEEEERSIRRHNTSMIEFSHTEHNDNNNNNNNKRNIMKKKKKNNNNNNNENTRNPTSSSSLNPVDHHGVDTMNSLARLQTREYAADDENEEIRRGQTMDGDNEEEEDDDDDDDDDDEYDDEYDDEDDCENGKSEEEEDAELAQDMDEEDEEEEKKKELEKHDSPMTELISTKLNKKGISKRNNTTTKSQKVGHETHSKETGISPVLSRGKTLVHLFFSRSKSPKKKKEKHSRKVKASETPNDMSLEDMMTPVDQQQENSYVRYIRIHSQRKLHISIIYILYKCWKFCLIGFLFLGAGMIAKILKDSGTFLRLPGYIWLFWISSLFFFVPISRIITSVISFLLQKILIYKWIVHFYYLPLMKTISRFFHVNLSFIAFMVLVDTLTPDHAIDVWSLGDEPGDLAYFYQVLVCILVLMWLLVIKSIAIRFFNARVYLSQYFRLFEKLTTYESWLQILVGEKKIFTPSITKFLVSFPTHPKAYKLFRTEHFYALCLNTTHNDWILTNEFKNLNILPLPVDWDSALTDSGSFQGSDRDMMGKNQEKSLSSLKKMKKTLGSHIHKDRHIIADSLRLSGFHRGEAKKNGYNNGNNELKKSKSMRMSLTDNKPLKKFGGKNDTLSILNVDNLMKRPPDLKRVRHFHQQSIYDVLQLKRQRQVRVKWPTLTFAAFKEERHYRGKTARGNYLRSWFDYCEAVDPLWKKMRQFHKQKSEPKYVRDHITLWAYDSKRAKVTTIDQRALKKVSKILAAYIMRYALSRTVLIEDEQDAKYDRQAVSFNLTLLKKKKSEEERRSIRGYLLESDFIKLFGNAKRHEAIKAFRRFDDGQKNAVTYSNLHRRVYHFLLDTINARQTYDSYQDILANLDAIVGLLVFFVAIFIFLLIFRYDVTSALSMYASLLALVLIFGNSALSSVINGVILIYLIQPFSVGDIIFLNDTRYVVKKMGLTSTYLDTGWGTPAIWSNTQMLNYLHGMLNYSRSRNDVHNLSFYVSQETTNSQLEEFRRLFILYVKHVIPMSTDGNIYVVFREMDSWGRTLVCLWVDSLMSFANSRSRWNQHNELMLGARKILEDLNIKVHWPTGKDGVIPPMENGKK